MMSDNYISYVASKLIESDFLNVNLQPSHLLSQLEALNTYNTEVITNKTHIDKNEIIAFLNLTLPCIYEKLNQSTGGNQSTGYNGIMENILTFCFYLFPPSTTTVSMETSDPTLQCDSKQLESLVYWVVACLAYVFLVVMLFCTKRKSKCCCWQRPGCLVTLNMLDNYENRFGYTMAFGLTVTSCVSVILGNYSSIFGVDLSNKLDLLPPMSSVFVKIFLAGFIATIGAPFFICQTMKNRLIGSTIGFFICAIWIFLEALKIQILSITCWNLEGEKNIGLIRLAINFPKYICLLLLASKFLFLFVKTIKRRRERKFGQDVGWMQINDTNWKEEYMYKHVTTLLKKQVKQPLEVLQGQSLLSKDSIKTKIKSKVYKYKPEFQYSIRILSSAFVYVLAVYIMLVYLIIIYKSLFGHDGVEGYINKSFIETISETTSFSTKLINQYITCIKVSICLGAVFAVITFFLVLLNSFNWYRRHILKLRKGDWSFLPSSLRWKNFESITPTSLMVASMKFAGYQIGYSLWGTIIIFAVYFVILSVVSIQIFLPMVHKDSSFVLLKLKIFWPTLFIGVVAMVIQRLLARYVFIINKDIVAVDNRRIYHGASYFFFYFNIFIGVIASLLRVFYGVILGVIFFQRLQQSSLPRYYDKFDPGYMSYIGYIILEHHHANPVVQCFTRLLIDLHSCRFSNDDNVVYYNSNVVMVEKQLIPAERLRHARARNRWHLFVNLSQNATLQQYRYHRLKVKNQSIFTNVLLNFNSHDVQSQ